MLTVEFYDKRNDSTKTHIAVRVGEWDLLLELMKTFFPRIIEHEPELQLNAQLQAWAQPDIERTERNHIFVIEKHFLRLRYSVILAPDFNCIHINYQTVNKHTVDA